MLTRASLRLFSTDALKVANDVAKQQFTVTLPDGSAEARAVIDYERDGNKITFKHTEVPAIFQGKGVGKILAKYAFEHALQDDLDVTCQCDYLAHYFEQNKNKYKGLKIKLDLE